MPSAARLCVQCQAMSNVFYAVDRLEGQMAVLVGDDETTVDLPRRNLPARVREGTVLRVELGADGRPDWGVLRSTTRSANGGSRLHRNGSTGCRRAIRAGISRSRPRPERAGSVLCAPLKGALSRRARALSPRNTKAGELSLPGFLGIAKRATRQPRKSFNDTYNRALSATRPCWWRDSNPHELSLSNLRGCRVYQFRHTSTERLQSWYARRPRRDARKRHRAAGEPRVGAQMSRTKRTHLVAIICRVPPLQCPTPLPDSDPCRIAFPNPAIPLACSATSSSGGRSTSPSPSSSSLTRFC